TNNGGACTSDANCPGSGAYCSTAVASCASLSWGTDNLFSGSGIVPINLVDYNANTTQGTFDCTKYGVTSGCSGGSCTASNDGNGVCNFKSGNPGTACVTSAVCQGGDCVTTDEPDELCGRTCTAGTTSGVCSANSGGTFPAAGSPNTVCAGPGTASTCNAPGT